jgi:hypothetical protein
MSGNCPEGFRRWRLALDNAVARDETAVMPSAAILVRRRHIDFLLVSSCGCPGSPPR